MGHVVCCLFNYVGEKKGFSPGKVVYNIEDGVIRYVFIAGYMYIRFYKSFQKLEGQNRAVQYCVCKGMFCLYLYLSLRLFRMT
ncbi:MAG: hypothetical protein COW04_10270 [Deltaproteobacteria bacterium CG12_big_fil_rev_8_21_14_0_65_43_10]|nr:MAG: hypothetical protein AUK23_05060 [Deltaproteobacteria bacterium CG2_30_43_15]PIQ44953.1 MAG: hypothetical protein COW04_10270 [Deltaproteobacteria bacterium CG12_big_fil_rev_8_21_14_0_65_43_10]PIU85013.1 MAG: hypothetical protein COS67_10110 [Deltaproteobacteria bacterium CG06_land_8_20_14_3_00_44_19]PIX24745.1 MAG: hypothetical protein COZ68_05710 [Deltaproteobacteria bacterium CG_4_8_14_3_um_filter_43_13]PIZ19584.1 MAG: hypothetical protein COY50_09295 [Deltaproteobacteria bacterium C